MSKKIRELNLNEIETVVGGVSAKMIAAALQTPAGAAAEANVAKLLSTVAAPQAVTASLLIR